MTLKTDRQKRLRSGRSASSQEEMEDILECILCCEEFNEDRRPRVLPCGHNYCCDCVYNLLKSGSVCCPFCKKSHPATCVHDFPINFSTEELIMYVRKLKPDWHPKVKTNENIINLPYIQEQKYDIENSLCKCEELNSEIKEYDEFLQECQTKHEDVAQRLNDVVNKNTDMIKKINDERKRVYNIQKESNMIMSNIKNKLPLIDQATSTEFALSTVADVRKEVINLDQWRDSSESTLPDTEICISQKILYETSKALSEISFKSDGPEISNSFSPIFSLSEKVLMLRSGSFSLSLTQEKLLNASDPVKRVMQEGRLFGLQRDDEGRIRSAKVMMDNNKIYLHCLRDEEPPANALTIPYNDLTSLLTRDGCLVFLDLSWNDTYQGRVIIRLVSTKESLALQFRHLCAGEKGPSYLQSTLFRKSSDSIRGGDYQHNSGIGGSSIVRPSIEDSDLKHHCVAGIVWATYPTSEVSLGAQYTILLKDIPNCSFSRVFGRVTNGMEIIREAAENIGSGVTISESGIILPL